MSDTPQDEAGPILVIEDSEDDFEAMKRAFRKGGLSTPIEHAWTGEEALGYLRDGTGPRPSLILLDLNMPGMGGRKLLEIVKGDEKMRETPVVVLTTSDYAADVRMCYALGANSYIQKPVDFDSLIDKLRIIKEYWLETAVLPARGVLPA